MSQLALPAGALGRLKTQHATLSPTLRRVTEHVLRRPKDVIYQTITELAEDVGVAEASVTRLCRKLGYAGFHAFKIALTSDLALAPTPPPDPPDADLAAQVTRQVTAALEETRRVVDTDTVQRVARMVLHAPRVEIGGQGSSGVAAQFLAQKLMRLGVPAVVHADPHLAAVAASTLPPQGVLIGFTRSGSTVDTVQNLRLAALAGAFTVAVTNRASSPATQHARAVLFTLSPEAPLDGGAISSLTSQLLLAEVLYLAVLALSPHAPELIRRTAESVVEKKY